ncbi:MAG TPA: HAMP domain-containing sensor histidine kinase [Gaiellaceae bacterium]|jgi:signal transduction histidine kinase|nr:HAMP domain-containing sensor histidine kinase [Gaiellaceae bacterium]
MNLRLRTILAAAAATMLAVVVLGSAVDVLVTRHLRHELDRSLRTRAIGVAQLAASAPALVTTPGALDAPAGGTQALVEVVDRKQRIVARSLSLGGRVLPGSLAQEAISGGTSRYRTVRFGGDELRVYVAPLANVSGGGAVLVAASTADLSNTISTLEGLTIIAALLAAGVGAAAAALLMRGALQPLARLDRAAGEIGRTGDARRRLPDPHGADEVGRLATTLNAMLDSLERARESERRFLADASHELRTPLTALRGNVAHLARHGATPALVADLEADAERLARLADDLLTLSREEAAEPPRDDVRLDALARAAGADRLDAESVTVAGDRAALERALGNLVENARRHGRGEVSITVRADGDRAFVTVEDEGEGVHVLDRERVFERFYGDGSGLGLAIVRATAERHGGRAYAEGPRITIELVRKASESSRQAAAEELEKGLL